MIRAARPKSRKQQIEWREFRVHVCLLTPFHVICFRSSTLLRFISICSDKMQACSDKISLLEVNLLRSEQNV